MDCLPNSAISQILQRVNQATSGLGQIAQEEGLDIKEVTKIWMALPIEDNGSMTYLEAASQCIIEVSNLIDQSKPKLPFYKKTAAKYRLMGKLLSLKAEQLF